ncbi:MAG: hypothetical protein M1837_001278 [Sclerophora amabilis]|nr:MAG: hypothetical protein M1837_001278 [Sclerophora amabilis]
MRLRQNMLSSPVVFLSSFLTLNAFISKAAAQDLPKLSKTDANNAMPTAKSEGNSDEDSAKPSETGSEASASEKPASRTASPTDEAKSAAPTSEKPESEKATITSAAASETESSESPLLTSLSSGGDPTSIPLPTIAGQYSYPPPSVPPTANAPFMQHSTLPEGTIFIAVGAGLGFLALAILAWRGLVAWSLHRSVKRAAMQQTVADQKTFFRPPGGGKIYSTTGPSSLSIDRLAYGGRGGAASSNAHRAHTPSESLFFSPTAARSGSRAGLDPAGNRNSGYLPAGFYAAGNSAPGGNGNGSGMTQLGGGIMNLAGAGPKSQGYTRARSMGPSPPGSPGLRPTSRGGDSLYSRGHYGTGSGVGLPAADSASSLNLNAPPQGRAPSAYLEDLFETHQLQPGGSGR